MTAFTLKCYHRVARTMSESDMNDSLQSASLADKSDEVLADELLKSCKSDGLSKECIRGIIIN